MNPNFMQMKKIGAFLDIFVTSPNRRTALERAHVHAKAAGLWDTMSPEEKEEFTFFTYYLWMIAADKRKSHIMRTNPIRIFADGEDDRADSNYHPGELRLGIEVELEHTNEIKIAKKIAKDHLDEIPNYYSLLVLMEKAHNDKPGTFFGDYFDAMGNKLQVLSMMVDKYNSPQNLKDTFEKVLSIYRKFKTDLLSAEKDLKSKMQSNPIKSPLIIQSVSIPASWGIKRSKAWLKSHELKSSDIDEKPNTIRFRQQSPGLFKNYFSHKLSNGVVLTLAVLKRRQKGSYAYVEHKNLKKTAPRFFSVLTIF